MPAMTRYSLSLLLCFALFFSLHSGATGAEPAWILLDENELSAFYLDPGAGKADGTTARVTVRVAYTEKGRQDAVDTLKAGKTLDGLSESRYSYDLDCDGKRSKLRRVSHLDRKGAVLKTTDLEKVTSWEPVPAGVRLSLVAEKVCTQKSP